MALPRHPIVRVFLDGELGEDGLELLQLRLFELGATGLEQFDQTTIVRAADPRVAVAATFEDEARASAALENLRRDFDAELAFIDDADWATEWRRGFGPQRIGDRLLLQPSWETVEDTGGRSVVTIDPENAFGSGDHETTRLALGVLERRLSGGERVLDVGCGSGILSIAAIKLGAQSAVGVDVDDAAIDVARRNAEINAVGDRFRVSKTSVDDVPQTFDVVLANIETRVLVDMPESLRARVSPGGFLVLSGILRDEREVLLNAFETMRVVESVSENEWLAFVMERP